MGKIDTEGRKIINDLITEDTERIAWLENTEPKFTGKKGAKMTRVTYNMKAKRYTYQDNTVPAGELIRLDIPDSYIYFSYHPTKQEYVVIDAPNRHEPNAKFFITAPFCHWIWERNNSACTPLVHNPKCTFNQEQCPKSYKRGNFRGNATTENCGTRVLH